MTQASIHHCEPYAVTRQTDLYFVEHMRKALERVSDGGLRDCRIRNAVYRATDVGGVYDSLPARPRIAFDEIAEWLERTRRQVLDQQEFRATS